MESSDSLPYDSHELLTLIMTPLFHFHSVVSALMTAFLTLIPLLLKISPKLRMCSCINCRLFILGTTIGIQGIERTVPL